MKATMLTAYGLVGLLTTFAVPGGDGDRGQKPLDGTWAATAAEVGGKQLPEEYLTKLQMTATFAGNRYTIKLGGKVEEEGTFTVDTNKTPHVIDLIIQSGKDEGKKQYGVYKVEGDTLTMHYAAPGAADRPKGLTTKEGEKSTVTVLKRQGKE